MGATIGKHFAATHAKGLHRAIAQAKVEMLVGIFLHRKTFVL